MEKTVCVRARDMHPQSKRNAGWNDCPDLQQTEVSTGAGRRLSSATIKRLKERLGLIPVSDESSASEKDPIDHRPKGPKSASASELTRAYSGSKRRVSLIDSRHMSSLLSMLRTEQFCGELDSEKHNVYLGKDRTSEFLVRRRATHYSSVASASDSAIHQAEAFADDQDSGRSVKKARTSSSSTPELSQKAN